MRWLLIAAVIVLVVGGWLLILGLCRTLSDNEDEHP